MPSVPNFFSAGMPEVRALYRAAARGAQERIGGLAGFDAAAQQELRTYRPIFVGQVRAAWNLSVGGQ